MRVQLMPSADVARPMRTRLGWAGLAPPYAIRYPLSVLLDGGPGKEAGSAEVVGLDDRAVTHDLESERSDGRCLRRRPAMPLSCRV